MSEMNEAEVVAWCIDFKKKIDNGEAKPFHSGLCDPPYHLTSITERFGKEGSAPAKGGVYSRSAGGFMGQQWDGGDLAFRKETWEAIKGVLYPGAFGMAFAGTRGYHRMACAIEDAGFVLHPTIFCWVYGSGFPKATRLDKSIDRRAGVKQEVVGYDETRARPNRKYDSGALGNIGGGGTPSDRTDNGATITAPATELAKAWAGHRYGLQAMKPAAEPIIVFQKPYDKKPVDCIVETGAGALNIDGGRIGVNPDVDDPRLGGVGDWSSENMAKNVYGKYQGDRVGSSPLGRWPANVALCHTEFCKRVGSKTVKTETHHPDQSTDKVRDNVYCGGLKGGRDNPDIQLKEETIDDWRCVPECPVRRLDEQAGIRKTGAMLKPYTYTNTGNSMGAPSGETRSIHDADEGGASRFFFNADWNLEVEERLFETDPFRYCPKASRSEREAGLTEHPLTEVHRAGHGNGEEDEVTKRFRTQIRNPHPTIKPISLARWLATLLLPPPNYAPRRLFVPFAGVASEMIGAILAGWDEITGVEMMPEYVKIGRARLEHWSKTEATPIKPRKVVPTPSGTPVKAKKLNTLDDYTEGGER